MAVFWKEGGWPGPARRYGAGQRSDSLAPSSIRESRPGAKALDLQQIIEFGCSAEQPQRPDLLTSWQTSGSGVC